MQPLETTITIAALRFIVRPEDDTLSVKPLREPSLRGEMFARFRLDNGLDVQLYCEPEQTDALRARTVIEELELAISDRIGRVMRGGAVETTRRGAAVQQEGVRFIKLPFPPSANSYWRTFRGITVVSKEAKQYKGFVEAALDGVKPFMERIAMTSEFHFPTQQGDLSNRLKVLEDALNGIAYLDDKQIVSHRMSKVVIPPIKKRKGVESTKRVGFVIIQLEEIADVPLLFDDQEALAAADFGLLT